MNERTERIGKNEALFRTVNEQVRGISAGLSTATEVMRVVCECGKADCTEQFSVSLEEYARVRDDSTLFLVRPDHEIPDTETVVDTTDDYFVVQKDPGEPAALAQATDPRS